MPRNRTPGFRPDITPIAQGLLSDRRKSSKRARKREDRDMLKGLLISFGMNLGNSVLKRKHADFANNESIMQERVHYKASIANSESILSTQKKIDASEQSADEYFADLRRGDVKQGMSEALKEQLIDPDAYESYITKKSREFGSKEALAHNEALMSARQIGTIEDFDKMVALNNKRPKNIAQFATNGVLGFFDGKGRQEIDEEALQSILNSPMAKNSRRMNTLKASYGRTQDLAASFEYAKIKDQLDGVDGKRVEQKSTTTNTGDGIFQIVTDETTDLVTGDIKQGKAKITQLFTSDNKDKNDLDYMKSLTSSFNYTVQGTKILTPQAFSTFSETVERLVNVPLTNIRTPDQWEAISLIWSDITLDPTNIKDPFRNERSVALIEALTGSINTKKLIVSEIEDPIARREAQKELAAEFSNTVGVALEALNIDPRQHGGQSFIFSENPERILDADEDEDDNTHGSNTKTFPGR